MRLKYSTTSQTQNEFDSLPRLPLSLQREDRRVEAAGLVDSGATVNVLPYELGLQLGGIWDDRKAIIQLAGNLSNQSAIPFSAIAHVREFPPSELVFAWVKRPNVPLILGQTNFFLEFDVCFYRSTLEFEVKPKSSRTTEPEVQFAICVAGEADGDLEAWKVYRVLPDSKADEVACLRVIDESGEDYLYPKKQFVIVELPEDVRDRFLATVGQ